MLEYFQNSEKSPSRTQIHGAEATPRRKDDSRQNSQVNTPSWKSANIIHHQEEKVNNAFILIKQLDNQLLNNKNTLQRNPKIINRQNTQHQTMIITENNRNNIEKSSIFQRSQTKILPKKEEEQTDLQIDQQTTSQNQQKDKDRDDESNISILQSQNTNKLSELNIGKQQSIVLSNNLTHQQSIQLQKEEVEVQSSSITQFQDEIIEVKQNKISIRKKTSDESIPDKYYDKLETLKEEQMLESLAYQQSLYDKKRSSSLDSNSDKKQSNQKRQHNNDNISSSKISGFQPIAIQKLELDKIPKFTLKRQLSSRETPTSKSSNSQWNAASSSHQQKCMNVTNYWRFVDKIHSHSNQILQNLQTDRREQAQLLNSHQITIPYVPFKKCHKKIKINFENTDIFKPSTAKFSLMESCDNAKGYLSSRFSSPTKTTRGKLSFGGFETFRKPQTAENQKGKTPNIIQKPIRIQSFHTIKGQKQQKSVQQDEEVQQNFKILLSNKNGHHRASSTNQMISYENHKKQSLSPISYNNIGEYFKKYGQSSSNASLRKQRMISPINGSKNNFNNNNKFDFDNYQLQKQSHKYSLLSPQKKQQNFNI